MAARQVAATATIEQLRTTFNTLSATDFGDISQLSSTISASNLVAAMNELESEVSPFAVTTISGQTDLGAAPATADSFIIRDADANALKEMTVANLFSSPTITTPTIAQINGTGITIDAGDDITLDADGGDIFLKDGGTTFGSLTNTSGNLIIKSGTTTAMTFSGANVTIAGNLTVSGTTTTVDSSTINVTNSFTFEGSTADSFETTLTVADPTADRTVTIQDATHTLVGRDTTDTLTNKTLTSPVLTTPIFTGATDQRGSFVFEGATADSFETTVSVVDPTADRTINFPNASGTVAVIQSGASIIFEGATADSFETTITMTDPTADRTITFPDTTGTVSILTAEETLTNKTLTTPIIAEIDNGSTITLDAGTDIILDADGGDIFLKDGGTVFGEFTNSSEDFIIKAPASNKDLLIKGNDNGSEITALTFDMSEAGAATFNSTITCTGITNTGTFVLEGSTADSFETTFTAGNPTSDITVTLPVQTGTVVVSNSTAGNDVRIDSLGVATDASGTAGEIRATNDITAFHSSDVVLKENIVEIPSALDMVDKIRGVFFDWKDDYIESKGGEDGYFVRKHDVGLIAQEVEKVLPEIVGTRQDGIKAIKYDRLVPLLLQAIKELQAKIK
tara:strand:+ start:75 stop:1949 length:1875 start_codon:yes stop_codon:yes gene_type:complete